MSTAKSTALVKLKTGLDSWLEKAPGILPSGMTKERIIDVALLAAHENPLIQKCTTGSLIKSILGAARYGLPIGGVLGLAYLVPYRDNKSGNYIGQLILGYFGMVELAYKSEKVAGITGSIVHEHDEFDYALGTEQYIRHKPSSKADSGKPIAVYNIITLTSGEKLIKVLTAEQVESVRARSKAKERGPWATDWEAMAMKTCFKQNSKFMPKTREFSQALQFDGKAESADEGFVADADVKITVDGEDDEPSEKSKSEQMAEESGEIIDAEFETEQKLNISAIDILGKIKHEMEARNVNEAQVSEWIKKHGGNPNQDWMMIDVTVLEKVLREFK